MSMANVCITGGIGMTDLQFGMCAGNAGHTVFHMIGPDEYCDAPTSEIVTLTPAQIKEGPPVWHQIKSAERLYAVTVSLNEEDRHPLVTAFLRQQRETHVEAYVFDVSQERWLEYTPSGQWSEAPPPMPYGIYAAGGPLSLPKSAKDAIRTLLGYQP